MDYTIPFKSLNDGKHQFDFEVTDTFFEQFPESEITQGHIEVHIELTKRSNGLETHFELKGTVSVPCDRCLEYFNHPIDHNARLFFEFGDEPGEVSDELIILSHGESQLELAQYLYEFINLALPFQKYHPNDANGKSLCNSEMIERLNQIKIDKTNDQEIDPRWNKLKDLIN
jgi:uncharacterized metal-binding protein YceD (DUF177 family)